MICPYPCWPGEEEVYVYQPHKSSIEQLKGIMLKLKITYADDVGAAENLERLKKSYKLYDDSYQNL